MLLLARTIDVIAAVMTARLLALLPDGREHHARERITLRLLWLLLAAPLVLMTVPMPQWLELRLLVQPEAWMPAIGAGLLLAHSLPDTQRPHARNTRRWSAVAAAALALFAARGSMRLFRMWQGDSGPGLLHRLHPGRAALRPDLGGSGVRGVQAPAAGAGLHRPALHRLRPALGHHRRLVPGHGHRPGSHREPVPPHQRRRPGGRRRDDAVPAASPAAQPVGRTARVRGAALQLRTAGAVRHDP
ncbi:hypothetical protein ACQ4WX_03330 [Streptomyces lasalocidi]